MDAVRRIRLTRMIEKMEKNPEFSEKIGMRNKSQLKTDKGNN